MLTDSSYDVTRNFIFDNGQRDSFYDHASITLKPGYAQPIGNIFAGNITSNTFIGEQANIQLVAGDYNWSLDTNGYFNLPNQTGRIGPFGMGWPGLVSNNGYLSIVGNSANPDYIGQELNQIFLADNGNQGIIEIGRASCRERV